MSSGDWTSDLEIRDNPGKLLFPGGTRDRGSKSRTVPGVPGQLAIMHQSVGQQVRDHQRYSVGDFRGKKPSLETAC